MKRVFRAVTLLAFTALFGLLISGLFGQALADGEITILPMSKNYPTEVLLADPRYKLATAKPRPWNFLKQKEFYRIFAAGQMESQIKNWDGFDQQLFVQRLDWKTARGIASVYPQFSLRQLEQAEKVLRKVKEEK